MITAALSCSGMSGSRSGWRSYYIRLSDQISISYPCGEASLDCLVEDFRLFMRDEGAHFEAYARQRGLEFEPFTRLGVGVYPMSLAEYVDGGLFVCEGYTYVLNDLMRREGFGEDERAEAGRLFVFTHEYAHHLGMRGEPVAYAFQEDYFADRARCAYGPRKELYERLAHFVGERKHAYTT